MFPSIRLWCAITDAIRLLLFQDVRKTFWSERWIDVGAVLSAIAERLGRVRVIRGIDVDDGWWEDRDLRIVNRGCIRLDVQALVEDHGGGKCLCRLRIRSRAPAATIPAMCGVAAVTLFESGSPVAWWLGAVAVAAISIGDVVLTAAVIAAAVDGVAAEARMFPVRSKKTMRSRPGAPEVRNQPMADDGGSSWPAAALTATASERSTP